MSLYCEAGVGIATGALIICTEHGKTETCCCPAWIVSVQVVALHELLRQLQGLDIHTQLSGHLHVACILFAEQICLFIGCYAAFRPCPVAAWYQCKCAAFWRVYVVGAVGYIRNWIRLRNLKKVK